MKIFSQRVWISILLAIALLILTGCGVLAYQQFKRMLLANEWVLHTHQVIETADHALLLLTDAESRLSLFLFTEDNKILKNIHTKQDDAKQSFRSLLPLMQDNPKQKMALDQLLPMVEKKIDFMNQVLKTHAVSGKEAAIIVAANKERSALREDIGELVALIKQEEMVLLEQRNTYFRENTRHSNILLLTAGGLSEFLLIISFILLTYHLNESNRAKRKTLLVEKELLLTNKRLKDSEERYVLATEGSHAGLWDWTPGTNIVYYSRYLKKNLGYEESEFTNTLEAIENLMHPDDKDRIWEAVNNHLENHVPYNIEYRLRVKTGDYHWFLAVGQALWDKNGKPIRMSGSLVDISQRKKTERLQTMEYIATRILSEGKIIEETVIKVVQLICESLQWELGAVWMVSEKDSKLLPIGVWQHFSLNVHKFGMETWEIAYRIGEGLPGRVWQAARTIWIVDVVTDPTFLRALRAKEAGLHSALCVPIFLEKKVVGVMEFMTCAKQVPDEQILKSIDNLIPQVAQFIQRKQAERELQEREIYNTTILKVASDCIVITDENGCIISCNPKTEKIFLQAEKYLIGTSVENLIHDISIKMLESVGKAPSEMVGVDSQGDEFPVEVSISQMVVSDKNMHVLIVRDITERKKIDKMKNEFVSVVSHELRTPLTSIRGSLGLIVGGAVGSFTEKARKLLEIANNNCERLLMLINDILDIEKIEAGKMIFTLKVVDIQDLVNESILINKIYANKFGVKVQLVKGQSGIKVNVDSHRVLQVLTNLISNAVKFSPLGATVDISIERNNDIVRVSIIDYGIGISEEFQKSIFQKFSQADSSTTRGKSGTGLGLSISKAIVEKLKGTLSFNSQKNQGAVFYFDLPIWNEDIHEVEKKSAQKLLEKTKDKLLVCEDDEDQAVYLVQLLTSAGYQVDVASSAVQAKKKILENDYRAILLDLILPDQDGIAFIRELRQKESTKDLPIIVISLMADAGKNILNGDAFSVVDWLDKPINFSKVLQSIERIKKITYPHMPRILHVEDDNDTQRVVFTMLEKHATLVSVASLEEARKILSQEKFDLVILDLLLPDGCGVELLSLFGQYNIPVIVYSSIELDRKYSRDVCQALVKSKDSNQELIATINKILGSVHQEGEGHHGSASPK